MTGVRGIAQYIYGSIDALNSRDNCDVAGFPSSVYERLANRYYAESRFHPDVIASERIYDFTSFSFGNRFKEIADATQFRAVTDGLARIGFPEGIEPLLQLRGALEKLAPLDAKWSEQLKTDAYYIHCHPECRAVEQVMAGLEPWMANFWRNHPEIIPLTRDKLEDKIIELMLDSPDPHLVRRHEAQLRMMRLPFVSLEQMRAEARRKRGGWFGFLSR